MDPNEVYPSNNPGITRVFAEPFSSSQFTVLGPTKPDGSVNFECHCVGHLVASPCGHEFRYTVTPGIYLRLSCPLKFCFREAITCQKASTEEELEAGACGDQLLAFMECVMRTQCFKSKVLF